MTRSVFELMSHSPVCVDVNDPTSRARLLLRHHKFRHLPVVDGERLVGVLSACDLEQAVLRCWADDGSIHGASMDRFQRIADLMTHNPQSVRADASLSDAVNKLASGRFHCLPVVDERESVVGILTASDLAAWLEGRSLKAPKPGDPHFVKSWTSGELITFAPTDLVSDALQRIGAFRHLPLMTEGRLISYVHRASLRGALPTTRLEELPSKPILSLHPHTPILEAVSHLRASSDDVLWVINDGIAAFTEHDACRYAVQALAGRGLAVKELASQAPETIHADATTHTARQMMVQRWVRHLPVMRNEMLAGVLSWRDLEGIADDTEVGTLCKPPQTIGVDSPLEMAAETMVTNKLGCLPVLDHSGLMESILTRVDILRALLDPPRPQSTTMRSQT